MKRIIMVFFFAVLGMSQLMGMVLPERGATEINFQTRWETLPRDLQILLLKYIISTSKNSEEAVKKLHAMARVSTLFYKLINDDAVNNELLATIADTFMHGDRIQAAEALHTNAALAWLSGILPEFIKKRVWSILGGKEDPYVKMRLFRRYMQSNQTISRILHNSFVKIWLIKRVLEELNSQFFEIDDQYKNGTEIAQLIYPHEITEEDYAQGLLYIDQQEALAEDFDVALFNSIPDIKALIAKGVDVNYTPRYLSEASGIEIMKLLVDTGINLNSRFNGQTRLQQVFTSPNLLIAGFTFAQPGTSGVALRNAPIYYNAEQRKDLLNFIEFLLQSGANPNIKDDKGRTTLALARARHTQMAGNKELAGFLLQAIELLKKYGAE